MLQADARNITWEKVIRAVEKVRDRLLRATRALESEGVPYAVIGGNAVAAWIASVDESATINTKDVDVLLRRSSMDAAAHAMAKAGFCHYELHGIDMFIDGPDGGPKDAVHVIFANEKVNDSDPVPTPDVDQSSYTHYLGQYRIVELDALVQMKLTSNRDRDRTHLRDMLEIGLIDATWLDQLPEPLRPRLQHILNTPGG